MSHSAYKGRGRWNDIVNIPIFPIQKPSFGKVAITTVLRGFTWCYLVSPFLIKCMTRYHRQFFRSSSRFGQVGGGISFGTPCIIVFEKYSIEGRDYSIFGGPSSVGKL